MVADNKGIRVINDLGELCRQQVYESMISSLGSFKPPIPDNAYALQAFEFSNLQWVVSAPLYNQYKFIIGNKYSGKIYEKVK